MSVHNSLFAAHPEASATVSASAGSGKTWLLVTRIIRLLLAGAEPGTIVALTFTRKAAAEMHVRLNERLYAMAIAADDELAALLAGIGAEVTSETRARARALYEQQLHALYPVRLRTFHSFCQDILSRFPLEADIPPGFELLEETGLLQQQAWETLFTEATNEPDSELAQDLDFLMQAANGPANTRTMLNNLLRHRSDWWAYTENKTNPPAYASEQLQQQLNIDVHTEPAALLFSDTNIQALHKFSALLRLHRTNTNKKAADCIDSVLASGNSDESALNALKRAFLTQANEPLKTRKKSNAQKKSMGEANEALFLQINEQICTQLLDCIELQKKQRTLRINQCWYGTGHHYIEIFQRLKREARYLDFSDLEWKCYQLLNTSENALWVQYKIDQHIDHILIDEFQDTNPTQWHLIVPVLEEIAAGNEQRWRSVFLVGDEKQSIYSFRRANPKLQRQASDWLRTRLAAEATPLDFSWRSSPAIITVVNHVFSQPLAQQLIPDYVSHDTHLKQLPGQVSLLPLFTQQDEAEIIDNELRNPLLRPRAQARTSARHAEADHVSDRILWLLQHATITEDGTERALECRDIMVLLRNRTHIDIYQDALRAKGIPFISNRRGGLLDNLEIQDMEKLIDTLMTPFNNLALAQVLRSPLFAASDDDLMTLASQQHKLNWYQRLLLLAEQQSLSQPLQRAATLLPHWHALADTIPVHDLLDRIYAEGNVLARYRASVADNEQSRVAANLQRFLELSLDLDAGRYPSLSHFLHYVRNMRSHAEDSLNEPNTGEQHNQLRLMTIHGSKGLEAPVVFLLDCNSSASNKDSYSALVDWPEQNKRPQHLRMVMKKSETDSNTTGLLAQKTDAEAREQMNLLYVALTRARQYLFISGSETARNQQSGWYQLCHDAMRAIAHEQDDGELVVKHGSFQSQHAMPARTTDVVPDHSRWHAQLTKPISVLPKNDFLLAPSRAGHAVASTDDELYGRGRIRGIAIHRAIDLLTRPDGPGIGQLRKHKHSLLNVAASEQELDSWLDEVAGLISNNSLHAIFQPSGTTQAYNEIAVLYQQNSQGVYGIVDRMLVDDNQITIIDYKTHSSATAKNLTQLAQPYHQQLTLYRTGVQRIWPQHSVRAGLLFTRCALLYWLD